jgi:hypothetical protein
MNDNHSVCWVLALKLLSKGDGFHAAFVAFLLECWFLPARKKRLQQCSRSMNNYVLAMLLQLSALGLLPDLYDLELLEMNVAADDQMDPEGCTSAMRNQGKQHEIVYMCVCQ